MTNGREFYFWDVGNSAKRQVAGFFSPAEFYEGTLTRFGINAVDRLFSDNEVDDLLAFTQQLAA